MTARKTTLGLSLIIGATLIMSAGCYGATSTSVGVSYSPPPPASVHYAERDGHVWVQGRWVWNGDQWTWQDGYWVAQRPGYVYVQGYWYNDGGWQFRDGYWDAHRPGYVYVRGYWGVHHGRRAWIRGRWSRGHHSRVRRPSVEGSYRPSVRGSYRPRGTYHRGGTYRPSVRSRSGVRHSRPGSSGRRVIRRR